MSRRLLLLVWSFWSIACSGLATAPAPSQLYIREYRVLGAHQLPPIEVEEAVYPFLGPGRTADDVEKARAALEKAYQDKGYQTVSVEIPQQQPKGGIVFLQVNEAKVGRLRVKGARYYDINAIKKGAPSLAEGTVPNFNQVTRDIVALNQLPDRRVTPVLRPGVEPGTVDIDLNVKDTPPLHASLELNNRYSPNTSQLRLNGSVSYTNLWQLGHAIGGSFQIAPERLDDAKVYSGYYVARFPFVDWLSVMIEGTKQDSNVSTLGSLNVAGRGEVVGMRAMMTLPPPFKDFYHSLNLGFDYKHFDQLVTVGTSSVLTPITYWPVTAAYTASYVPKGSITTFDGSITYGLRGLGSNQSDFDFSRFNASGNFIYLRADLAHTHDLPAGFQAYGRVQGQLADQPLINSEQFGGGGLSTVRGYLESEVLGDNAIFGTVELRSPSLFGWFDKEARNNEWRIYIFGDAGTVTLRDTLPEQASRFNIASFGIGSTMRLFDHLNGEIDAAVPTISQTNTQSGHPRVTFRVWGDF